MFKKILALLLVVSMMIATSGCMGSTKEPPMEKIQKTLTNMENYRALCTVTFISPKGENTYKMLQFAKTTGEYRIEMLEPERLKDTLTICDGNNIVQIDNRVGGKVYMAKPSEVRNLVLLNSFVKNFMQSEDATVAVSEEEKNTTLLETLIPGNNRYLAKQNLLMDNKTIKPIRMTVLDQEDAETIIVQYEEFEYNVELDESMFVIPKQ